MLSSGIIFDLPIPSGCKHPVIQILIQEPSVMKNDFKSFTTWDMLSRSSSALTSKAHNSRASARQLLEYFASNFSKKSLSLVMKD